VVVAESSYLLLLKRSLMELLELSSTRQILLGCRTLSRSSLLVLELLLLVMQHKYLTGR
jgi:hypothetical protein